MARNPNDIRIFKIFRYDPTTGEDRPFDRFDLKIENQGTFTILDALFRIQEVFDPSLSFRYSCRVGMCGSCGMVINGRESLACKTVIADLKEKEITVRPLNHFPIVKDLVVDMDPFFDKYEQILPYFQASQERADPAVIRPDSRERKVIGLSTECIACGCCVSSCTMAHWYKDYLGPGALNRAFTLLADSRDGLSEQRLAQVLGKEGCYNCRLELNCTEVCPKEISPTRGIKYIQRLALKEVFRRKPRVLVSGEALEPEEDYGVSKEELTRRRFFSRATLGLGMASALFLGGLSTITALFPSMRGRPRRWVRVGRMEEFPPDRIKTVQIRYQVKDGFYDSSVNKPILISRKASPDKITVFDSRCPHLGCSVRWDEGKDLFLCACHGGAFYPDGRVKAGPPPRPLERYLTKIKDGDLFVLEA